MTEAVIFDLDDTLCDYQRGRAAARECIDVLLTRAGVDADRYWAQYNREFDALFTRFLNGEFAVEEYRLMRFMIQGVDAPLAAEINRIYVEETSVNVPLFDDVIPCLEGLRARGLRLAVLTNGPSDGQRMKLKYTGLEPYFPHIYISTETGFPKPDSRAFRQVLDALELPAAHVVMVGDSLRNDCLPAEALGIRAVQIDRSGAGTFHRRISTLAQLPAWLE